MRYWHAHGMPYYATATWGMMNKSDSRVPRVLHSISHLLCAVLALGSATCNTENSNVNHTRKCMHSVCYCCAQKVTDGVTKCIMHNLHVVWHMNIMNFPQIFANSAGNTRTFPPGIIHKHVRILVMDGSITSPWAYVYGMVTYMVRLVTLLACTRVEVLYFLEILPRGDFISRSRLVWWQFEGSYISRLVSIEIDMHARTQLQY